MSLPLDRLTRLSGFGRSSSSLAYLYRPTRVEEVVELFAMAARQGLTVGLRGSGRSYGDAALNGGQIVLDFRRMNRILEWNPATGVIRVEPGVTIQQLWQYTLEDGYWPPVVPGTMFPTLGGCLGMNIHGKNNYRVGPIGEHVLAFTALLPNGETVACSRAENSDLFHALISGAGLLGVFTSITLKLKKIYSGQVQVHGWATANLRETMTAIEEFKTERDYVVGWIDSIVGGAALGRGQIHTANYLAEGEDPRAAQTLRPDYQILPDTFFGLVPKSSLWMFMRPFGNNFGWGLVNTAKYLSARYYEHQKKYWQSLVAFSFLLDYVPNFEKAYGSGGLIQYQVFLPKETALAVYQEILLRSQKRGLPSYLAVIKRHRPDQFLFTHATDGYSLALDFRVTRQNARALQEMTNDLNRLVAEAGGRFYFAKDSTLTPHIAARYLGDETLARFHALKQRCDPQHLLQTELYRRVFAPEAPPPAPDTLWQAEAEEVVKQSFERSGG